MNTIAEVHISSLDYDTMQPSDNKMVRLKVTLEEGVYWMRATPPDVTTGLPPIDLKCSCKEHALAAMDRAMEIMVECLFKEGVMPTLEVIKSPKRVEINSAGGQA